MSTPSQRLVTRRRPIHSTRLTSRAQPEPGGANRGRPKPPRRSPALLVVVGDPKLRRNLANALRRRFGIDYRVLTLSGSDRSLATLDRLGDAGVEVALAFADFVLPTMSGIEFLTRIDARFPQAKRIVLAPINDMVASEELHRAQTLGQLDLFIEKPWRSPEEWLYSQVSDVLAEWWRANRPRFERVRVIGEQWNARSHELRDLGTRNVVAYGFYPADSADGRRLLDELGLDSTRLPVVTFADGRVLVEPSNAEIAEALGVLTRPPAGRADVTIVGAGPAGLTAALYAASEGLRTVVVETEALGGQAGTSAMIRNYLGFPRGISGEELTRRAYEQALSFGARFVHTQAAVGLGAAGRDRVVTLANGSEIVSRTVVLATGVSYRRLEIPALERLVGAGVFYGAATSEARSLRGEDVFIVGAGNSAGQAAIHLAEHAARVTLLVRAESLAESMSAYLIEQLRATPNVAVRPRVQVVDGAGQRRLETLVVEDMASGRIERVAATALFVLIGGTPRTGWLDGSVDRDERGYILTDRDFAPSSESFRRGWQRRDREPLQFETSLPGVFAIGDVRHNSVKRVASAVGAGAMAIASVHAYLAAEATAESLAATQRSAEPVGAVAGHGTFVRHLDAYRLLTPGHGRSERQGERVALCTR